MSSTHFLDVWRQHLSSGAAGLHLADPAHPLQIFVGSTDEGAPRMVLRTSSRPVKPALSQIVLVERYQDSSGKWNVSFTLQDRGFDEVFLRLTDDVHTRSAQAHDERSALDRVAVVFDEWRRLLRPRRSELLTMEELRGLVGELWLVLNHFSVSRSMEAAVQGWLGPMGLPQDFWFDRDGHFEAKAIGPATTRVRISSEHQLDADDLELLVLTIANTAESTVGAFNLPGLVSRVTDRLVDEGAGSQALEDRIARLGVQLEDSFYAETWFVLAGVDRYAVSDGFPRIVASALPQAIERVKYEIGVAAIVPFHVGRIGM